ncbi:MAG: porin [Thermodesulfobacteriota bacterium]|nr:porin [Thermodesulfobacteriota bacterium]
MNIAAEYYGRRHEFKFRDIDAATSIGFEYLKIFSGDYGDWLTFDLQFRLAHTHKKKLLRNAYANYNLNFDFNHNKLESILTADMNLMPEIHNAYANFRLSPLGHYLKMGHFDVPFGLEPLLDTHPTILQTQATKNVGFKRDWGLSLNGQFPSFDYELSATIGSGGATKIWRKDGSYLLAGRVGSPADTLQYGLSVLYGNVLMALYDDYLSEETVSRKRVGLDIQYEYKSYLLKGELAWGQDEDRDVLGTFLELDYTPPSHQSLRLESQLKHFINDLGESKSDDTILSLGTSYKLNEDITLRFAWSHDFNLMWGREDDVFTLQAYYYSE